MFKPSLQPLVEMDFLWNNFLIMTIRVALSRTASRSRVPAKKTLPKDGWALIRGLWKGRSVDAVDYQRRIREEADRKRV